MNTKLKDTERYYGYANYETWLVNLWLTNDECYYIELKDIVAHFDTDEEMIDELKAYVNMLTGVNFRGGIAGDLLTMSLEKINWLEIIEANKD